MWLDIRNWIRNIEQHASDNVNKVLVGNKADMDESKRVGIVFYNIEYILVSYLVDWTVSLSIGINHPLFCVASCVTIEGQ